VYPVTELFQQKIQETTRTFKASIQVQHSAGVLTLTDEDIILGTMSIVEGSQTTSDFSVGAAVSTTFEVEILSKYSDIEFEGATVIPQISLLVDDDVWESVPLGRFMVDEVFKGRAKIKIKALDYMIELDKPYALSTLSYPATLYQIYMNICSVADVQPGTSSFINQEYLVNERPQGDYTLRDILSFVAAASGSFARFNRLGALELCWYTSSGIVLTGANRFDFQAREDVVGISGVSYTTVDDVTYITGTDEYVVDLTDNPLVQGDLDTLLPNIYDGVKDTKFTPFESRWQGNPAVQPGDKITQIDRDGNEFDTIVTHSTYKYRGASTLAARGLPVKAKRYTGSTNKKIAEIKRRIEKEVGDKLTSLEQAQLNVTELIANMLGGYVIKTDEALYIADNPDISLAQKVWKWGLGGFGYSENGVEGPYTTGVSADGTIVAMLVAANIITADMVKTGVLSSEDDSTWINLNDGSFNFKDLLKYTDGELESTRSDKMARSVFNADTFAMQVGDGSGSNWTNKLYFDPVLGKYVFDGTLSAEMIEALEAQFDVTVSNVTITNVLAAETGYIAQLTVDSVETSTKVQNYLAESTEDVNYIKIFGQYIQFVTASTDGSQTEQARDRHGALLYWKDEDKEAVVLDETDWPVMIYVYTEQIKAEFGFENTDGIYVPKITLGLGDGVTPNSAKAEIYKGQTGLEINYYRSNTGELRQIKLADDGIFITPYDLEQLDFYSNGFTAKYSGETILWNYEKDGSGRITELITEDNVVIPVNWHGGSI
jgi:hypothetical protein